MTFKTEQEAFWAGDFGTEYIQRNQGDALLASNLDFFCQGLACYSLCEDLHRVRCQHWYESQGIKTPAPTARAAWH